MSDVNGLCSNASALTVADKAECITATKYLNLICENGDCIDGVIPLHDTSISYFGTTSTEYSPSGCVLHRFNYLTVHWNYHKTGSPSILARQVCRGM